ncbi:hypothetical protein GJ744_005275 [Endocarpon pusillum]|uniref:MARVEL domain-containing protein n=1 Tax=Endocarpon pusillum TaxID=364733 RepID=A0A8H7DYG2_9EURO|nr:hypothetical protein GJ744_005275 [Endocarpon pusillum]
MANQYNSRPIYSLRRCFLILAILSFLLNALAATGSGPGSAVWIFHILLTLCSAVLCIYDLVRYALAKARDPETKPVWPSKKILAGDAVLAAVFGWWYGFSGLNLTKPPALIAPLAEDDVSPETAGQDENPDEQGMEHPERLGGGSEGKKAKKIGEKGRFRQGRVGLRGLETIPAQLAAYESRIVMRAISSESKSSISPVT